MEVQRLTARRKGHSALGLEDFLQGVQVVPHARFQAEASQPDYSVEW
jgi:hypothetical protein